MKTLFIRFFFAGWLAAISLANNANEDPLARITDIALGGTNIVVTVDAAGSLLKVTLESSSRVGKRSWEPRAVRHLAESTESRRSFTFELPLSGQMEILRVRAESTPVLSASFFDGTNSFVTANQSSRVVNGPGGVDGTAAPEVGDSRDGGNREVAESDIYKLTGDTLYFFNQYRGLQVIDVSSPDAPRVTGNYDIAAAGEQMYVIGNNKIVLLARNNCAYLGESASRVILLEVIDGQPRLVRELPVNGYIQESRMVGSALYVVAGSYQQRAVAGGENWIYGALTASFDLSDFHSPVARSSIFSEGYPTAIYATDQYLFMASTDWTSQRSITRVAISDITDPAGTVVAKGAITLDGMVRDKFKMHQDGNVFSVVTFDWSASASTRLHNFSLADPNNPERLGSLEIIKNEQLHATRFHGKRLYAVTFFVIDPLWIIDLTDPANPRKVGELEIPGWSSYLQPIGDTLLAIGRETTTNTWRTTVQLFDVANPAAPSLLSKIFVGDRYSGSEAEWDEKAFGVFPEENLVLVPFYASTETNYIQGVQLVDLLAASLVKRGVIEQNFGARRATIHKERILSLSARELLTVNAADRDHPSVVATTHLSWAADQVHLAGNHLIEVDAYRSEGPLLRIVSAADPGEILSVFAPTNLPYLGSAVRGDRLYVLQGRGRELIWPREYDPATWRPIGTNEGVTACSMFDLTALPELRLIKTVTAPNEFDGWWSKFEPLEVLPELIVWASSSSGAYWAVRGDVTESLAVGAPAGRAIGDVMPWWIGGSSGHYIATHIGADFRLGAHVQVVSPTNNWWSFGDSFEAGGVVYTSHLASEFDPEFDPPPYPYPAWDGTQYVTKTNDPPPGAWVQKYYLDAIDFNEPDEPLIRKPVNIPGSLIGLHRNGEILYTQAYEYVPNGYSNRELLMASAFDGVEARLVDSIQLPAEWPHPTAVRNGSVYLGQPPGTNQPAASIDVLTLDQDGKWTRQQSFAVDAPVQQLRHFGDLLVAQSGRILLLDSSDPAAFRTVGTGLVNACYGLGLDAADGDLSRGVWIPMGWSGVVMVPVDAP